MERTTSTSIESSALSNAPKKCWRCNILGECEWYDTKTCLCTPTEESTENAYYASNAAANEQVYTQSYVDGSFQSEAGTWNGVGMSEGQSFANVVQYGCMSQAQVTFDNNSLYSSSVPYEQNRIISALPTAMGLIQSSGLLGTPYACYNGQPMPIRHSSGVSSMPSDEDRSCLKSMNGFLTNQRAMAMVNPSKPGYRGGRGIVKSRQEPMGALLGVPMPLQAKFKDLKSSRNLLGEQLLQGKKPGLRRTKYFPEDESAGSLSESWSGRVDAASLCLAFPPDEDVSFPDTVYVVDGIGVTEERQQCLLAAWREYVDLQWMVKGVVDRLLPEVTQGCGWCGDAQAFIQRLQVVRDQFLLLLNARVQAIQAVSQASERVRKVALAVAVGLPVADQEDIDSKMQEFQTYHRCMEYLEKSKELKARAQRLVQQLERASILGSRMQQDAAGNVSSRGGWGDTQNSARDSEGGMAPAEGQTLQAVAPSPDLDSGALCESERAVPAALPTAPGADNSTFVAGQATAAAAGVAGDEALAALAEKLQLLPASWNHRLVTTGRSLDFVVRPRSGQASDGQILHSIRLSVESPGWESRALQAALCVQETFLAFCLTFPQPGRYVMQARLAGRHVYGSPLYLFAHEERAYSYVEPDVALLFEGCRRGGESPPTPIKLHGVAFHPTLGLLVPDRDLNAVLVFHYDLALGRFDSLTQFGTMGTEEGQFQKPSDADVDPEGNVIVCDKDNHRLQIFSPTLQYRGQYSCSQGVRALSYPWGVHCSLDGRCVICDSKNNRVLVLDSELHLVEQLVATYASTLPFNNSKAVSPMPRNAVYTPAGHLAVLDYDRHQLLVFNPAFDFPIVCYEEPFEQEPERFKKPDGLCVDAAGNLLVVEGKDCRLCIFNSKYECLAKIGLRRFLPAVKTTIRLGTVAVLPDGKIVIPYHVENRRGAPPAATDDVLIISFPPKL